MVVVVRSKYGCCKISCAVHFIQASENLLS